MNLIGAPNFRDLGGYISSCGHAVRRGRLFRSDHLGALQSADLADLAASLGGAVRVLDLRGVSERESAICAIPGATVHSLPIEPTIVQKLTALLNAGDELSAGRTVALMQDTYRGFVRVNTPRFAALFQHVLEANEAPIFFHCTAGKDRTGFAAALLLRALDVPHDVVVQDYMRTNDRLAGKVPSAALPPEIAQVLWSVQPAFLEAAFDAVEADFGSLDAYLRTGLGLRDAELGRLRHLYLEVPQR
ncbi:MAG: tyrosine-protein phosphatase [Ramlibacter sp.]